jgi:hypothetical protein
MADYEGVQEAAHQAGWALSRLSEDLRHGLSRTVAEEVLSAYRGPLVPTGVCPVCQLRMPVLRSGRPARHWPHRILRRVRLVPSRGGDMTMTTVCAGSEVEPAGLLMIR